MRGIKRRLPICEELGHYISACSSKMSELLQIRAQENE